jgi:DNA recombination protein RmuC
MQTIEILIFILLLAIVGILVYVFFLKEEKKDSSSQDGMVLLQQQLQALTRTMDARMGETSKSMQEGAHIQFRESKELMQGINREVNAQIREIQESINEKLLGVQKHVSEVSESSKQVFTIAEQLQNLEKVLKHQKQRGNLGEASLQLALENMLPATAYKLQYLFPGGDQVDAVIVTKDGLIPVDAKFSLDNYRRLVDETDEVRRAELEDEFKKDLKKRIDETAKYIRPKDDTLPFAFMYIPAEAIYYDLLVNEVGSVKVNTRSLIDYAYKDKNVIIVSPTTFAAYLQSVLYGFRAFKIEESAKQIGKHVESLSRHLKAYDDYFKKVGVALGTTVNHYNTAQKELGKVDKDVAKITGSSMELEPVALSKPEEN